MYKYLLHLILTPVLNFVLYFTFSLIISTYESIALRLYEPATLVRSSQYHI